jgi:transposase
MKISHKAHKINLNNLVDISTDVHKDELCFFFEIDGKEFSDSCRNSTRTIKKKLLDYREIAKEHGKANLRIICEPTGEYHNKLMRTARRLDCFTNLVSGEAVAKFRVIETNDYNKTDQKDPRVIATLGKLNKLIRYRVLPENYLMRRKLHKMYDDCEIDITSMRCKISRLLVELFCDYSFKADFIYSRSGQSLMLNYDGNPYRIVKDSFDVFVQRMKKDAPRIQNRTLKRLYEDAQQSVLNELPSGYLGVLEDHLCNLMVDYQRILKRKQKITDDMKEILQQLREDDPLIPPPTPKVISEKNLARLFAETGPLSDFLSSRQLMRYAGLNLRTRQSGKYQGQNKISKRGRGLLRKVLNAIVLPLVRKGQLYGDYYHSKKEQTKMPGTKAMTIVARKMLTKIFGWYRSGKEFNEKRFFTCESRYESLQKAA